MQLKNLLKDPSGPFRTLDPSLCGKALDKELHAGNHEPWHLPHPVLAVVFLALIPYAIIYPNPILHPLSSPISLIPGGDWRVALTLKPL